MFILGLKENRSPIHRTGVDFSQVDLSSLYIRIGLALAILHIIAIVAIPSRRLSHRIGKIWRVSLVVFLLLGWASVFVGFVWPEVLRGHDWFNIISMIGGLVVFPFLTLLASLIIWLRRVHR